MDDTIADKIQNKKDLIAAAYSKCNEKGATLPDSQNIANLADCINTIELPPVYTGEYNITSNDTLQTAGKKMTSDLKVNVPQGLLETAYITPSVLNSDATTLSYTFDFVPKVLCLISQTSVAKSSTNSYIVSWLWDNSTGSVQQRVLYVSSSDISSHGVTQGSGTGTFPIKISGTKVTWSPSTTLTNSSGKSYNFRFKSGVTYRVLALG